MKKYDVRFSQGYSRYHCWRCETRVEANNEEEAKTKIIESCKSVRPNEKVMCIKVKEAEDFICWTYNSVKLSDGTFGFKKEYYTGYHDLRPFGIACAFSEKKEDAKKFQLESELRDEIKKVGRKLCDYKIEKVKA